MKKYYKFTLGEDFKVIYYLSSNKFISASCYPIIFNNRVMGEINTYKNKVEVRINKNYSWDGCSPKVKIGKLVIGIWDGFIHKKTKKQKCYYPSLVHDFLLQFRVQHNLSLSLMNELFLFELLKYEFELSYTYYSASVIYTNIKDLIKRVT